MITLLSRLFIRDRENIGDAKVRTAWGMLCGFAGIGMNLLLFALKFLAGTISGSIAIRADAFNNLSDAGSSVITLLGFRLAGAKPDSEHPFGHGRFEYVSGLIVSFLIIHMGLDLFTESIGKIRNPEPVECSWLVVVILAASILGKLYMFLYNRTVGRRIDSAALQATASDSISDTVSTFVVLIATLIGKFSGVAVDAWCGMLVAAFILYSGGKAAWETIDPLLGKAPDPKFVTDVRRIVLECDKVSGIHDMVVHDYGPGRTMVSLHAEVSADEDILEIHDAIDLLEKRLRDEMGCEAVVHMDPIVMNDEKTRKVYAELIKIVHDTDKRLSVHDFRMVPGPTHTNLVFDIVAPYEIGRTDEELKTEIENRVHQHNSRWHLVINVDKSYVR